MENPSQNLYDLAQRLKTDGYDKVYIISELRKHGATDDVVKEVVDKIIHHKSGKKLRQGLNITAIGALILFSSFLLTITSGYTHFSTDFVLYGLTSIGICIVMYGLYLIFD
jgi:hypothetical protein